MTIKETYEWIRKNTNLMQDTMMLDFECLAYCIEHGILEEVDKEHFSVCANKQKGRCMTMTDQEIFEILADNEEKLFYAVCRDRENIALKKAHESAKQSLKAFAPATGCHN